MTDTTMEQDVLEEPDTPQDVQVGMAVDKSTILLRNQVSDPKSSIGLYDLPCGYLDSEGNLHTEIAVREITGVEEDMLANPKIRADKKLNELITRCTERIGTVTDRGKIAGITKKLPVGDRVFLVFAIRRATVGDVYTFEAKCSHCSAVQTYSIDLSELDTKPMKDPYKRVFDVVLPRSGKTARFRVMTGEDEERVALMNKKRTDTMSLGIFVRLEMLDDKPPTLADVKSLGTMDREFLRQAFEDHEGGVETEVELDCAECLEEFKEELDVSQASFFFPSAIRKS